jgi:hypothetical protein
MRMRKLHRFAVAAASLTFAAGAGAVGVGLVASPSGAATGSGDYLSPPSTQLTVQRAGLNAAVIVNGIDEAIQCQMTWDASTPAHGMSFIVHHRPQLSACVTGTGTQAQATVTTRGTWKMSALAKSSSTNTSRIVFAIPPGGLVFTYAALPGCKVSVGDTDLIANYSAGGSGFMQFFNKPAVTSTGCTTDGWVKFGGDASFQPAVVIAAPNVAAAADGTWSQAVTLVASNSCGVGKVTIAGTLAVTISPRTSGGVLVTSSFKGSAKPETGWRVVYTTGETGFKAAATLYKSALLEGFWLAYTNGKPTTAKLHVTFHLNVTAPDTTTPTKVTHRLAATQCF